MQIYAASYLLPINGPPVERGAVVVDNGLIRATGRLDNIRRAFTAPVHEFPGAVILPGLVNAHTHLELTDYPGWLSSSGLDTRCCSYVDWIIQVIRVKRTVGTEELATSLLKGLNLALQSGTTMVGDILSDRQLIPLYKSSHLAGRIYLEFLGQDNSRYSPLLATLADDIKALPRNFLPGISPHAPFTVSSLLLQSLLTTSSKGSIPVSMHLSESVEECSFFADSSGKLSEELFPLVGWNAYVPEPMHTTSTKWLDSSGALSGDFLAVHGVHLSSTDIKILKKRGVSVVLVPRSNHFLGVGKAPVNELLRAGISLSLGTDSLASCTSLSLWDEMKFLLDRFPQTFSPDDALRMATINGAKAIRRDHDAGTLEPGKRADFIVMEPGNLRDPGKISAQLIENSRLHGVWCGGENVWIS